MNDQRFERKYIFNCVDINKIITAIYRSDFNFFSSFPDRLINSIYFDDKHLSMISENLDGITDKTKIRIRWYGNMNKIINPNLELKKKTEFLVDKNIIKIKTPDNFLFQDKKNILLLKNLINQNNELKIQTKKRNLVPILSTHYTRSYFLSSNKLLRLTLDKNLEYINLADNKDINLKQLTKNIILELNIKFEN